MGNTVIIPSVPDYVFENLQPLLALNHTTARWKLDFRHTSSHRGRLTIRMANPLHEEFVKFIDHIELQMKATFMPSQFQRRMVFQTRSSPVETSTSKSRPDGGISFYKRDETFLVYEVAHSQTEKAVRKKARDYVLDTNQRIKVVVVVSINKTPHPKDHAGSLVELSPETDTVHVSVCKFVEEPEAVSGEYVVDGLQIFPGAIPDETFEITWADVNRGPWDLFRDELNLSPDTPEPVCHVNFHGLHQIAMELVSVPGLPQSTWDPKAEAARINKKIRIFDPSSSIEIAPSTKSPGSSEGRREDSDYEPSENSLAHGEAGQSRVATLRSSGS